MTTAGLPAFTVVGLPDKAVAESRERVRAALAALGLALPSRHITVNLSPAELGRRAVAAMLDLLAHRRPRAVAPEPQLVVRLSTRFV